MKTVWLISPHAMRFASREEPERGLVDCHLAGIRLRTAVAALEWRRCGNENLFWDPAAPDAGPSIDWRGAKICVVPKYYHDLPLQPWLDACLAAKSSGCQLVIDICDFPFKRPRAAQEFYSAALKICDVVTVNSERMAELMEPYSSHRALVIEDAIIGAEGTPKFSPRKRLELLWFGHPSNLPFLQECLGSLIAFGRQRRCRLTIMTMEGWGAEELAQQIETRFAPTFEARFNQWSLEAMRLALRKCDLVLIPSDAANPAKMGASANRIAEAIRAGRFAVASPLPSYLPFSDAAWLGLDMVEGIKWALANPGDVLARIRRGQARVAEELSEEKISRRWRELFESLT